MITADDVTKFLQSHPDFFVQHPDLLEILHVPHAGEGNTVSLVERQVKVLRERQAASRERLAELVRNARSNEQLTGRIHHLSLRLLHARSQTEVHAQLQESLRVDFGIEHSVFLEPAEDLQQWLSAGKPRCGHFASNQRARVFGEQLAESLHSMALVPIGPGATLGVLALGSPDTARFAPGISTDFLERMGELIGAALSRTAMPVLEPAPPS